MPRDPRNNPQKPPRQTTLQQLGLAFPTLRRNIKDAIIDGALQIQKLPLAFGFLALNQLVHDNHELLAVTPIHLPLL